MESLKEFEPHIVRSKYHPDKLFCRITGRLVQAKESAVVQHSTGKRFERGIELLTSGEGKLLDERPPEELLAERERSEKARKVASEAKRRAAAEAAAARKREAKVPDEDDESEEKIDPKVAAERERIRINGGFSKEMGCWVPPRTCSSPSPSPTRVSLRANPGPTPSLTSSGRAPTRRTMYSIRR